MVRKSILKTTLLAAAAFASLAIGAHAAAIFIDYGDTQTNSSSPSWNNQTSSTPLATINSLIDSTGVATGIKSVASGWSGLASVGGMANGMSGAASTAFGTTSTAEQDYMYSNGTGVLTFSNLDLNTRYTFTIFASRNSAGDRTGNYTATGSNSSNGLMNATYNESNVVILSDIVPTSGGIITLSIGKGGSNTSNPVYVNALRIDTAAAVPEPSTFAMLLGGIGSLIGFRRRRA